MIFKHALRNALIPIVTVIGVTAGVLLSRRGGHRDRCSRCPASAASSSARSSGATFPIIQGGLLVTACVFVFVNIVVDMLYGVLDPRVRDDR